MAKKLSDTLISLGNQMRVLDSFDLPDKNAKKEELPFLVNGLISGTPEQQSQVILRLLSIALHGPLIVMLQSVLPETSLAAWEALSKLIKTCPNFRDALVRYGFIETVRYSLLDDDTPIHVQSNLIDIVTQLLLNQTDPQSMSELIGVLQRKVDLNDNDNELQIGRKSKYIMTLLSSQGVTGGQSVKEISRLSKMNEEYKREIILLRSEFEERLRELDEYKHGERNKNQNIDQFKRQVDELRQKDIENQQLISALQLQINQLRNVVVNIEPLQTPIPKQERKKKPEVIEFIETQPAPIIAPPQIPKQFDVPFHITAPPGSYYKDEDEYTYTATGNEYKTFALDNILTAGIFQLSAS